MTNEIRLIDAKALKKDFQDRLRSAHNWKENALNNSNDEIVIRADATIGFICEVIMTINKAPTIEERPKGKWLQHNSIEEDLNIWHCSNCKMEYCSECGGRPLEYNYYFCPNCGADMRGNEND